MFVEEGGGGGDGRKILQKVPEMFLGTNHSIKLFFVVFSHVEVSKSRFIELNRFLKSRSSEPQNYFWSSESAENSAKIPSSSLK